MKTLTAKALTAAVVIGGTLFATGGTSFAADTLLPKGSFVYVYGTGATGEEAKAKATSLAQAQCQSGKVTTGNYHNRLANGFWVSTYTGNCL
ncbi:hypothetical protein [Candidatus Frankia nodulisporulans]|uniref:hypothetical protein n=1 Tax=Candidatus Frankia nodulisporulans TaxID=2060052 RepID=UPI0013D36304|nr:hypothetical protein [Candidatus Frankia nodulisporulans]